MNSERFILGPQVRMALRVMGDAAAGDPRQLPRLDERGVVTLVLEEPREDDRVIEEDGRGLLAVSRAVMDKLGDGGHLEVFVSEDGRPAFRVVPRGMGGT